MAKLVYSAICSLDGYVADAEGAFDVLAPDEEVHTFVNEQERPIGTYLLGRRMYDVMVVWETMDTADEPAAMQDYSAIWRAARKVVYSTTLTGATSEQTRIEAAFDPEAVRRMKEVEQRDLSIGGPHLAAQAFAAGLVDEVHLFVTPVTLGGGNPALPHDPRLTLELVDHRRFANGVVHLHYRIAA